MELKYAIALYICAGVAAVFVIAAFINVRFKRKYKKGKKTYLPDYIKNDPKFKSKMFWYAVLKYILIVLIITSLLLSGFLMARPRNLQTTTGTSFSAWISPRLVTTLMRHLSTSSRMLLRN